MKGGEEKNKEKEGVSTILSQAKSQMEESQVQRRGSKAYQIFPEANLNEEADSCSFPEDFLYKRERLPSIVVEPTESESRERCRCLMSNNVEEDSTADQTDGSVDGEQQEDMRMEEGDALEQRDLPCDETRWAAAGLRDNTTVNVTAAAPDRRRPQQQHLFADPVFHPYWFKTFWVPYSQHYLCFTCNLHYYIIIIINM
ncbi:hypothetical protein EYF80_055111 [Liparis tanakae]|uniref:Uncharacterized protein n=1 Tax=Liparis tanakae TaxID=230148 RepID=A0A4Z2F191_9TELE|nr:hypothetical protein EYF80_055111 [Liparis tanakae]